MSAGEPPNPYQPPPVSDQADELDSGPLRADRITPLPAGFWGFVLVFSTIMFFTGFVLIFTFPIALAVFFGGVRTAMLYRRYNQLLIPPPPAYTTLLMSTLLLFFVALGSIFLMCVVCIGTWRYPGEGIGPLILGTIAALVSFVLMFIASVQMGSPKR